MRQQATVGLASAAIESIQINSTALEIRNRRTKLVKHRRVGSELVACIANLFFWLSRSPIHVWVRPESWRRWENKCFYLLYNHRFQVFAKGRRTVYEEKFPGKNLLELLSRNKLGTRALQAAAEK
jgi:hypothetical protein